jgi:hypothetical protein
MDMIDQFRQWWANAYPPDWWAKKTGEPLPAKYRALIRNFVATAWRSGYTTCTVDRQTGLAAATINRRGEFQDLRIALDTGLDQPTAMLAAIKHFEAIEKEWPDCGHVFRYDQATGIATIIEG